MPGQPTELRFDYPGIILALLVASGVHEGRWTLAVDLGQMTVTTEHGGVTCGGLVVALTGLRLRRLEAHETMEPGWPVVDAALVNPADEQRGVFAAPMN